MSRLKHLKTERLFSGNSQSSVGAINFVGTIRGSQGTGRSKMRTLGRYAFVYLLDGSGEYGDALGHRLRVSRGDLICLFPELPHFYGPGPGEHWDEIYIGFEGLLFDLWRRQKIITPSRPIWRLDPVDVWFKRIKTALSPPANIGWEGAFCQLSQFQMLVANMWLANRELDGDLPESAAWLTEACRSLGPQGPSTPNLEAVARSLGMSYENFRKKFTQRMGMAPAQYRQARLIDKACALLLEPARSNKEIAETLGFCDAFHFSKIFRKRMGFSPRAFRLKALGISEKYQ